MPKIERKVIKAILNPFGNFLGQGISTKCKLYKIVDESREECEWIWNEKKTVQEATAQCALCSVYFPAQLNKLRPILNLSFGIPLNIYWSQLFWVHGKYVFSRFCDFQTQICDFPVNMPLYPPLLSYICPCFHPFFLYCIGYRVIKNTGAS